MSELEDSTQVPETAPEEAGEPDVQMAEEGDIDEADGGDPDSTVEEAAPTTNPQTIFLDYLKSPIVELVVGGSGNGGVSEPTLVTAHQAILSKSPYFAERLQSSTGDTQRIELPDDTIDAVGCFLQYQYTGEYFPRRLASIPDGLELDPSVPEVDSTGAQLLKHARIYNLAEKLGLPELKTLAHSKIHRINSTAIGEIAYARYVYGNTPRTDATIRRPVAAFWATRSHVLRHEAEDEFRRMCLEYPQFGFDVLSIVLDQREKKRDRDARGDDDATPGRGKKRPRPSVNI